MLAHALFAWSGTEAYEFPFTNEYASTIIGTPAKLKASVPEDIKIKNMRLTIFKDRVIPDPLWYEKDLRYSLAYQKDKAPLIWIIAGTGAGYNSPKMLMLQRIFYQAGFHVVSLTSPTHPNFIVSASSTMVPGHLENDSKDLYHVMEMIWEDIKGRIDVTEFHLTGYSLGSAQAAFAAKLDEERKSFNFSRVFMINPPVSLYNSVDILDRMLEDNIPGGLNNFNSFWTDTMTKFSDIYKDADVVEFNNEFLYEIYKRRDPPDERMAAVIGLSFRISSMNMLFATDVMTNAGYIVPGNLALSSYDPLTDYFKVYARTSFVQYFDDIFYPYFSSKQPGLTREDLIDSMSLKTIEDYLKKTNKIWVVHNEDDIILAPGEIDFFRQVFGDRANIYPLGGHCGNIDHRDNVKHMIDFFTTKEIQQ
jgi:hypothetical protein